MGAPKNTALVSLSFFLIFVAGCSFKEPPPLTPVEADKKLIKTLTDEFHYKVVLKNFGKTLWIYLPKDRDIFLLKGSRQEESRPKPKRFSVQFLEGNFADKTFHFEYDIISNIKSPKNNGVSSDYSEEFNQTYRNLLGAVGEVYLNTAQPPEFIIVVIADIRHGVEIQNTFYLEDFKKYQAYAIPYEEYILRVLTQTRGSPMFIGDADGNHISGEITLDQFLTDQMVHRINFKYQNSDFEPGDDAEGEILKVISQVVGAYQFTDFAAVELSNLRHSKTYHFNQQQLKTFSQP